jgi:hypothetical protein
MDKPIVSIQLVVKNGTRYLRHCLDAVRAQTYQPLEVVVLDNASSDGTPDIIASEYPEMTLIRHPVNLGTWPGQEFLLSKTHGTYIVALSVDVLLDTEFISRAVAECERDRAIAAVQGKVYQYSILELAKHGDSALRRDIIDTCGFALTRGRTVVNIGHGMADGADYAHSRQILGVEGATPFFRRDALEQCRIQGHITDPDYFWYGDDLDLAWRMTLFGHRQIFAPDVIAWHDRSTTKGSARTPIIGQLTRLAARRAIPLKKRRWDWSNTRFTIIKNDYIINILRDMPYVLIRQLLTLIYTALFEPGVFLEAGRFVRLVPAMLRRRRLVMRQAVLTAPEIHRFFV